MFIIYVYMYKRERDVQLTVQEETETRAKRLFFLLLSIRARNTMNRWMKGIMDRSQCRKKQWWVINIFVYHFFLSRFLIFFSNLRYHFSMSTAATSGRFKTKKVDFCPLIAFHLLIAVCSYAPVISPLCLEAKFVLSSDSAFFRQFLCEKCFSSFTSFLLV